jgi:hypothetical protein
MFDATGIRGAFTLQAAINCVALVVACLMIPLWLLSPQQSREQLLQAHSCNALPTHQQQQQPQVGNATSSPTAAGAAEADKRKHPASTSPQAGDSDVSAQHDQRSNKQGAAATHILTQPVPAARFLLTSSSSCSSYSTCSTSTQHAHLIGSCNSMDSNTDLSRSSECSWCISSNNSSGSSSSSSSSSSMASDKKLGKDIDAPVKSTSKPVAPAGPRRQSTDRSSQQQLPKLDLSAVLATVKDPAIFGQCVLLLLEQAVRNSLTVVLPAAMGTRQLVVGMVYLANVSDLRFIQW